MADPTITNGVPVAAMAIAELDADLQGALNGSLEDQAYPIRLGLRLLVQIARNTKATASAAETLLLYKEADRHG